MQEKEGGLFPSMAKPQAGYLLEGRVLITATWAGLQDGFIKTAPFNAKARSPRSLRAVQRALFSFGFHTAPPTPRLTPFLPLPPLSKPAEFPLQPRHELQPKNNFRPPLSSQCIWGRHPGLPFPPYPP